jgi:hypothetical protein
MVRESFTGEDISRLLQEASHSALNDVQLESETHFSEQIKNVWHICIYLSQKGDLSVTEFPERISAILNEQLQSDLNVAMTTSYFFCSKDAEDRLWLADRSIAKELRTQFWLAFSQAVADSEVGNKLLNSAKLGTLARCINVVCEGKMDATSVSSLRDWNRFRECLLTLAGQIPDAVLSQILFLFIDSADSIRHDKGTPKLVRKYSVSAEKVEHLFGRGRVGTIYKNISTNFLLSNPEYLEALKEFFDGAAS